MIKLGQFSSKTSTANLDLRLLGLMVAAKTISSTPVPEDKAAESQNYLVPQNVRINQWRGGTCHWSRSISANLPGPPSWDTFSRHSPTSTFQLRGRGLRMGALSFVFRHCCRQLGFRNNLFLKVSTKIGETIWDCNYLACTTFF